MSQRCLMMQKERKLCSFDQQTLLLSLSTAWKLTNRGRKTLTNNVVKKQSLYLHFDCMSIFVQWNRKAVVRRGECLRIATPAGRVTDLGKALTQSVIDIARRHGCREMRGRLLKGCLITVSRIDGHNLASKRTVE